MVLHLCASQVQRLSTVLADTDLMIKAFLMVTSIYSVVLGGLAEVSVLQNEVSVETVHCMCVSFPSISRLQSFRR